ncbi:hemin uptake protein HemP [Roseateles toxinivorans]|nr:hemin uptake protein HemP [Roseateles toxinivorans]
MDTSSHCPDAATGQPQAPRHVETNPPPARWTSEILLGGAREAQIDHQGCTYRLRLTQLGKLILTK